MLVIGPNTKLILNKHWLLLLLLLQLLKTFCSYSNLASLNSGGVRNYSQQRGGVKGQGRVCPRHHGDSRGNAHPRPLRHEPRLPAARGALRSAEQTPRLPAAPVGGLQDPGVSKRGFAGVTPSPRQPMSSGQALVSLFTDDSNQLEPSTGTRATSGS